MLLEEFLWMYGCTDGRTDGHTYVQTDGHKNVHEYRETPSRSCVRVWREVILSFPCWARSGQIYPYLPDLIFLHFFFKIIVLYVVATSCSQIEVLKKNLVACGACF